MSQVFLAALVLLPQFALANTRTVHIPVQDGKVVLINSSPSTVYYSVNCPDKVTKANIISPSSGLSVGSKTSVEIVPGGSGCASGATLAYTSPEGVQFCSKSATTYAQAASLCGGSLCTFQKLQAMGVTSFSGSPSEHWMSVGHESSWSTCSSACNSDNLSAPIVDSGAGGQCRSGPDGTGYGPIACHLHTRTDSSLMGAACCPSSNGSVACEITIEATTSSDGFLQSPSFKGGAPF